MPSNAPKYFIKNLFVLSPANVANPSGAIAIKQPNSKLRITNFIITLHKVVIITIQITILGKIEKRKLNIASGLPDAIFNK